MLARGIETGEQEEVGQAARAGAAGDGDGHLGHEQRVRSLELGGLALQLLRSLESEADADVVAKTLADGQLAIGTDSAAKEDPGRAVGAGGQHDGSCAQFARARRDTDCPVAGQQDAVDERVGEDRQVVTSARGVEVGEGRVPADGADRVDRVHDRLVPRRRSEGAMPRRQLVGREPTYAHLTFRPLQVRLDRVIAPAVAPFVVVRGGALEHDAGVVSGAATQDPGAQLRAIFTIGLPSVREGQLTGIEHVLRPAPVRVLPVVRSRLDETDPPPALAQARSQDAARRAATDDQYVEARSGGHGRGRYRPRPQPTQGLRIQSAALARAA